MQFPIYLNRTGRFNPANASLPISFICVPIRVDRDTVGALGVAGFVFGLELLHSWPALRTAALR